MMQFTTEAAPFVRVTATQTGVVSFGTSTRPSILVGVLVGSVLTAPTVQMWVGQTTGAGQTIIGTITCSANAFTRIPAYCSGGATIYISACTLPDLTIFYNPIGSF